MRTEQAELTREEIYREWLGLHNPGPSYYGLLGVPELETDETAIHHAARRVKRKVRAYQIGLYRKQALELLAEIGQAVSVLTNPEKKRSYDNDLVRRWRGVIQDLYHAHCKGSSEPAAVEAWLSACEAQGVPVARLLPRLMRTLALRTQDWPRQGEAHLPLSINLWIYRDLVVLGQCLHVGSLETRVDAVKHAQKLLAIPEGAARLMVEEVARSLHLFSQARLVRQAQRNGDEVLLRLGRRIRRFGGHVGPRSKTLVAAAILLGRHKHDMERAVEHLGDLPADLSPAQLAAYRARRAGQKAKQAKQKAREWVAGRPQILVGAAILAGVAALVLAFLVAAGVWKPWPDIPPPSPDMLTVPKENPAPPTPVVARPEKPPDLIAPDELLGDLQGLQQFINKRPGAAEPTEPAEPKEPAEPAPPVEPAPTDPVQPIRPPVKPVQPGSKEPPVKPPERDPRTGEIRFFGVEGKPATPDEKNKPPAPKPKTPVKIPKPLAP
jgi:hypothetical protein